MVVSPPFRSDLWCNWALEVSVLLYRIRSEVIYGVIGHWKCVSSPAADLLVSLARYEERDEVRVPVVEQVPGIRRDFSEYLLKIGRTVVD